MFMSHFPPYYEIMFSMEKQKPPPLTIKEPEVAPDPTRKISYEEPSSPLFSLSKYSM